MSQNSNSSSIPDFSVSLLLGQLLNPVISRSILQIGIDKLTNLFVKQHPRVISKMAKFTPCRMVLIPIDMPFCFFVEFTPDDLNINIIDNNAFSGDNLTCIKSSLELFVKMLEGNLDGDALFFSRKLSIEGDTTSIVALRNILEAESINIKDDIEETLGVFSKLFYFVNNIACGIYNDVNDNLDIVKTSIIGHVEKKVNYQASINEKQKGELKKLEKQVGQLGAKIKSIRDKIQKKE